MRLSEVSRDESATYDMSARQLKQRTRCIHGENKVRFERSIGQGQGKHTALASNRQKQTSSPAYDEHKTQGMLKGLRQRTT